VALASPALRGWMPGPLPSAIAGYVAQWPTPPGQSTATLFPLFPWMSYALVGACLGLHIGRAHQQGRASRLALMLAAAALPLGLATCEPLPVATFLREQWPWLTQLLRTTYRLAAALLLGGLAIALVHRRIPLREPLLALGRASLVVYWVHLQFAFGSASKPIARALDFEAWAMGLVLLTAVMIVVAMAWLRLRARVLRAARTSRARGGDHDAAGLRTRSTAHP
jgi:hypothetical protein